MILMGGKIIESLWKTAWHYLLKLDRCIMYNLAVALAGLYAREKSTNVQQKTCARMFPTAFLVKAPS